MFKAHRHTSMTFHIAEPNKVTTVEGNNTIHRKKKI